MPLGGLIIGGAGLLLNAGEGIAQNAKANAIKPKDPVYNIPREFFENREIARQMAQLGIPQQQYNNAVGNINQSEAAAIAAAQNSNNPGGAIAAINRQGNQAKAKLDAEDAQARQTNQRYFINENEKLAGQELQKQQSDVFDKFTRDFNQMQAYRGASMQNFNNLAGGAQQLGETVLNYKANNPSQTMGQRYNLDPIAATNPSSPNINATPPNPFGGASPVPYPGMFKQWNGVDQSLYQPLI